MRSLFFYAFWFVSNVNKYFLFFTYMKIIEIISFM